MTTPNRYDELGPLTRPIIDRLINALASSHSAADARDAYAYAADATAFAYSAASDAAYADARATAYADADARDAALVANAKTTHEESTR